MILNIPHIFHIRPAVYKLLPDAQGTKTSQNNAILLPIRTWTIICKSKNPKHFNQQMLCNKLTV